MKICPVCGSRCFDDMEVCYGCLHTFSGELDTSQAGELDGMLEFEPEPATACTGRTTPSDPVQQEAVQATILQLKDKRIVCPAHAKKDYVISTDSRSREVDNFSREADVLPRETDNFSREQNPSSCSVPGQNTDMAFRGNEEARVSNELQTELLNSPKNAVLVKEPSSSYAIACNIESSKDSQFKIMLEIPQEVIRAVCAS